MWRQNAFVMFGYNSRCFQELISRARCAGFKNNKYCSWADPNTCLLEHCVSINVFPMACLVNVMAMHPKLKGLLKINVGL